MTYQVIQIIVSHTLLCTDPSWLRKTIADRYILVCLNVGYPGDR